MTTWLFGLTEDDRRLLGWSSDGDLFEFVNGFWITPCEPVFVDDLRTADEVTVEELKTKYGAYIPHSYK